MVLPVSDSESSRERDNRDGETDATVCVRSSEKESLADLEKEAVFSFDGVDDAENESDGSEVLDIEFVMLHEIVPEADFDVVDSFENVCDCETLRVGVCSFDGDGVWVCAPTASTNNDRRPDEGVRNTASTSASSGIAIPPNFFPLWLGR